jgi:hypothetical protein
MVHHAQQPATTGVWQPRSQHLPQGRLTRGGTAEMARRKPIIEIDSPGGWPTIQKSIDTLIEVCENDFPPNCDVKNAMKNYSCVLLRGPWFVRHIRTHSPARLTHPPLARAWQYRVRYGGAAPAAQLLRCSIRALREGVYHIPGGDGTTGP